MLLDWRARRERSERLKAAAVLIERAVEDVIANPATRTRDIGGTLHPATFSAAINGADARRLSLLTSQ
jgi:isocitrate/isopropylmalate dehydrogenase